MNKFSVIQELFLNFLQLPRTGKARKNPECNHTVITHYYLIEKKEVSFVWQAPEPGTGCVEFRWALQTEGLCLSRTFIPQPSTIILGRVVLAASLSLFFQCVLVSWLHRITTFILSYLEYLVVKLQYLLPPPLSHPLISTSQLLTVINFLQLTHFYDISDSYM